MKNLNILPTDNTPEVVLDINAETLTIKGVCAPENPKEFFNAVNDAVEAYKNNKKTLQIDIFLEYFNTGSSKCLLNLFLLILSTEGNKLKSTFNWMIEEGDDELKESGQIFEELTGIKFNYINI